MDIDLLVIGGGINGVGVARDAAARGLRVVLVEKSDLGSGTSSASSKLIHGGLRYLEQFHFRLVQESLAERATLLRSAPHIVKPLQFIIPLRKSTRPTWVIRTGLLIYDCLSGTASLGRSRRAALGKPPFVGLKETYPTGYTYFDCSVDDARLVISTAMAARQDGARIYTRAECSNLRRVDGKWVGTLVTCDGRKLAVRAAAVVNAAGAWSMRVHSDVLNKPAPFALRLVQGSHIVVPSLYQGQHGFVLQNDDRRIVFAYPYLSRYTLVGTTEVVVYEPSHRCRPLTEEVEYLCTTVEDYFGRRPDVSEIIVKYAGIRPLLDDGSANASRVTRDYRLIVDGGKNAAPLISIVGGKITTYRRLAEKVVDRLEQWLGKLRPSVTAVSILPGGNLPHGVDSALAEFIARYPEIPAAVVRSVFSRHGSLTDSVLGTSHRVQDLGEHFGGHLYAKEVDYFVAHEWAKTAEDILERRTKICLDFPVSSADSLTNYLTKVIAHPSRNLHLSEQ